MTTDPIKKVAVVAPAGTASDDRVRRGLDALQSFGVEVQVIPTGNRPRHYLAGDDGYRADALRRAWSIDVDAIWALRGGFGSIRTLQTLGGYADPKPLFGFSDITAILAHAPVGWHAPVVTQLPHLDAISRDALASVIAGTYTSIPLSQDATVLKPGRAVAGIIGGNLTVLGSLCGTPWQVNCRDKILFLEDVGEPPYRVDRVWTQLKLSGALDGIRGLILGRFTGVADGELSTMRDLFVEMAQDIDGPVLEGLPVGHLQENVPIPVGKIVDFNSDSKELTIQ